MYQPYHTRNLAEWPPELIIMIFENLPNFECLLSIRQTCQYFNGCFQTHASSIASAVFSNICHSFEVRDRSLLRPQVQWKHSSPLIWQLIFATNQCWIQRDVALKIFRHGWTLMANEGFEELLHPIGKRLAASLRLQGYQEEATTLFEEMGNGLQAFRSSRIWTDLNLQHEYLASSLLEEENYSDTIDSIPGIQWALQQSLVALVTPKKSILLDVKIHLPQGLYIGKEFAMIRVSKPPRPRRMIHGLSKIVHILKERPEKIYSLLDLEFILNKQPGLFPQGVLEAIQRLREETLL